MKIKDDKDKLGFNILFKVSGGVVSIIGASAFILTLLDNDFRISLFIVLAILALDCILICILLHRFVLKPLYSLYNSIKEINFDKDIIDFTRLDSLEETGIAELKMLTRQYKYLVDIIAERINRYNNETYTSEHDKLTGCYNRTRLERHKSRYEQQKMMCIIFIDVNNLKKMNDIFGHEAGDALLKNASKKLSYWNSYGDLYRLGGDEFMIVLPNKKLDFCMNLLNLWYPTVGVLNRESDGFKCLLSYGVSYARGDFNFDDLVKEADEKMYDFKVNIKKQLGEEMR